MTLLLIGAGCGASGFKVGDSVYAEWVPKTWYAGTIDGTCDKGYHVSFDDGDDKCVSENQLVQNDIPAKSKISVGTNVLAKWTGTPFYDATVIEIDGDTYKVQYYDGVKYDVGLSGLRLDPRDRDSYTADSKDDDSTTTAPSGSGIDSKPVPTAAQLPAGTKVHAKWHVSGNYWPGEIKSKEADGTYTILWEDNTTQAKTKLDEIRLQ